MLRKIENIVREEMNAIGSSEVLMTALGAKESWEKTGRWDAVDVLFKLPGAEGKEYAQAKVIRIIPAWRRSPVPRLSEPDGIDF